MTGMFALSAARIFDGFHWHADSALVAEGGQVRAILPHADLPPGLRGPVHPGLIAPGFVDLQANGGGGVLFNDSPTPEAIAAIAAAHARTGTTALLPTLITDRQEISAAAVAAGAAAAAAGQPGLLGLHLEGPHLSVARKGAHDPALIRPLDAEALTFLIGARARLPALLSTLAPESAGPEAVNALARAGVTVSLGHSDCSFGAAAAAAAAGARLVTHLFNAMSQIGNREPGLAGAALALGGLSAGVIADGIHVHPETLAMALRAKAGPGRLFLVTDAMPPLGTEMTEFRLNGRLIRRAGGRLTLPDGTLAGADLTMPGAIRILRDRIGLPVAEALRMASLYPAEALGVADRHGHLRPGARADAVALSEGLAVQGVWIGGRQVA